MQGNLHAVLCNSSNWRTTRMQNICFQRQQSASGKINNLLENSNDSIYQYACLIYEKAVVNLYIF